MHNCLRVPEIVHLICNRVDDTYLGDSNCFRINTRQSQLYALARTCQLFRGPALASLWEDIYDLTPIIKCAGRDLWTVHPGDYSRELRLTRDISPSDVNIMKKYASLVRHLTDLYPWTSMTLDVWRAARHAFEGAVLFPNLRSIHFLHEEITEFSSLFGTDSLTHLEMRFDPSSRVSMVTDFLARCTSLMSVRLLQDPHIAGKSRWLVTALGNWQNLSQFVSDIGTPETLQALLLCSNSLRYVEFLHFQGGSHRPCMADTGSLSFSILKAMKIGIFSSSDAISFFEFLTAVAGTNLRRLLISFHDDREPTQEQVRLRLLQLLENQLPALKVLDINDCRFHTDPALLPFSSSFCYALATHFPTLTHINIVMPLGGYEICDEDIRKLTEALPMLEEFSLNDDFVGTRKTGSRPKIASLVFFAHKCPFLSFLALHFDAQARHILRPLESTDASNMKRLQVFSSEIDDPQTTANFILDIFPGLRFIDWDNSKHRKSGRLWSEVARLIAEGR